MILELSEKIWNQPQFQDDYKSLISSALKKSLRISNEEVITQEVLNRLLRSASTFAGTNNWLYREPAYRIGIASWILFKDKIINMPDILTLILSRMGNFPACNLLNKYTISEKKQDNIPIGLWFEINSHEIENTVIFRNEETITLTDFQISLWQYLRAGNSITVTAPTSAGKSYALQHFLVSEVLRNKSYHAVYLVPTRALINQVSNSLTELMSSCTEEERAHVSTIPVPANELGNKVIYVLTQERLQLLHTAEKSNQFNLIVVDESQMLSEDSRGVVLQTVVEKILEDFPETQIMFAAPLTKNPEVFSEFFELDNVSIIDEEESPVAQNFIYLDITNTTEVTMKAILNEYEINLGTKNLDISTYDDDKQTLACLSWEFGKLDKNLVYSGGQAACEDIANMILQLTDIDSNEMPKDQETINILKDFALFIKEHIHPKYILANTIEQGIAFHYGNMPSIVRKTIEDLFVEGKIRFLVCTSTLLQGVNLPAKNLFMLNPTKGREWGSSEEIPISSVEFWNLAGRAGRLGKDFEGNVFLINLNKWICNPLEGEKKQIVQPSLLKNIKEKSTELLSFINDKEHSSGKREKQGLENTFVKLFNEYKRGNLDKTLKQLTDEVENNYKQDLVDSLKLANSVITVPQSILEKNITISPYRQQALLDYLIDKISKEGPERCIPLHPSMEWKKAFESMWRIFKRLHTNFENLPGKDKSHFYFGGLALRWMRGDSLKMLIDDAYDYKKKHTKREPSIGTVIREVMKNIEQDIRFRYVKYTSCYNDLLKQALIETENEKYIATIPSIPLYLELGACSKTMVSFIGVGLSRTTAGILSGKAVNKDMSNSEAMSWIKKQNLEGLGVPTICIREISKILS